MHSNAYINPHGAGLLRRSLECVCPALSLHDERSVVFHGRVIEIDVGDGIEIGSAARLLLILIRIIYQHLTFAVEYEPAIVGPQV
jgi:hypothetical protein